MTHPHSNALADLFAHLYPEMVLVAVACILFIGGLFKANRTLWGGVALGGLLLAFLTVFVTPAKQLLADDAVFGVPLLFDSLAHLTRFLALAAGVLFVLLAWDESPERHVADHHACVLIIIAGVSLVGASNDLVTLFLSLELISIPTYILLYLPKHDDQSQEASLKYFLLSVFSSALLLFGFSYLFGLTGTTNIAGILHVLYGAVRDGESQAATGLAQVAMLMIAAGLGFRITAVPFHFYAPDVYQGTSTSGAALLSYIPKLAGFVAIVRVFGFVVPAGVVVYERDLPHWVGAALTGHTDQLPLLFWFLAVLTMTVGNFLALLQDNLKRLLAYSGVAHAGYMLIGLASAPFLSSPDAPSSGVAAVLFYLIAYGSLTFGIFAVMLMLHRPERPVETVDDLAGLSGSHPGVALLVTILMLSFIGMPLTAGFLGKSYIFFSAMTVQYPTREWLFPTLALIGVVNAAVAGWYYLRIITVMYLRTAVKPIETRGAMPAFVTLVVCVVLTLALGIPPGATWMLGAARQAGVRPVVNQPPNPNAR